MHIALNKLQTTQAKSVTVTTSSHEFHITGDFNIHDDDSTDNNPILLSSTS